MSNNSVLGSAGCAFDCVECLHEMHSLKTADDYAVDFMPMNDSSLPQDCLCPNKTGTETGEMIVMDDTHFPDYDMVILTVPLEGNETAIVVNVTYWAGERVQCRIEYYVQKDTFLSVEAKNSLVITFYECNMDDEDFEPDAVEDRQQAYLDEFASIFNGTELPNAEQINVTLQRGDFCPDPARRRRLLSTGNDEEVTVVIVFASADDADGASDSACDQATTINQEASDCSVVVTDESTAEEFTLAEEAEVIPAISDNLQAALIAIAVVVLVCLLGIVALYCHYSQGKQREKDE